MKARKVSVGLVLIALVTLLVGCIPDGPDPTESPVATPSMEERVSAAAEVPQVDVGDVLDAVDKFFQDARLYVILVLIGLDIVFGIAVAIKVGVFRWVDVAQFYRTMVVPYVLGYLAVYVSFQMLPSALDELIGVGPAEMTAEALVTLAFAGIVIRLGRSIWSHWGDLGLGVASKAKQYMDITE